MKKLKWIALIILSLLTSCKNEIKMSPLILYPSLIDYTGKPSHTKDLKINAFMDEGSWFGLSFYSNNYLGIAGLYSANSGSWLSNQFFQITFPDYDLQLTEAKFFPGFYLQSLSDDSLRIVSKVYFYTSSLAVCDLRITNHADKEQSLQVRIDGRLFAPYHWQVKDSVIYTTFEKLGNRFTIALTTNFDWKKIKTTPAAYAILSPIYNLKPNKEINLRLITYFGSSKINHNKLKDFARTDKDLFQHTYNKWNKYLLTQTMKVDNKYKPLAVKSLITLVNNWKEPYGPFKYSIIIPSYSAGYFTGIWAWDTWKHAVATSLFNTNLAKDMIREMFRWQDSSGMIYDCVYLDETKNFDSVTVNSLDTKPPLAAWAVWNVFLRSHDTAFLRAVYPKLKRFHYWWYKYRDYNHNGLCEYGARKNKVYAARWESGMDDAVRFDTSRLIANDAGQYSLMQESPDLNAFLYADKLYLSHIAATLGLKAESDRFKLEANILAQKFNSYLWDTRDDWYYDRHTVSGRFVRVRESTGWIPLWAGVPDSSQAAAIARRMADRREFNTRLPLPTVSASDPRFMTGYWRGPVWIDQVYFGLEGLRRYGYDSLANALLDKIIQNAQGMSGKGELYENYSPIDGRALNARNFSWTAASLLLILNRNEQ